MSTAFLNNAYMPITEAKISPLDRGFLFGDGIYEVIPAYNGRLLGFDAHIQRMQEGLKGIGLSIDWTTADWKALCTKLSFENGNGNLGIYLQVSRGTDSKRYHAFPEAVTPTIFGFTFDIPQAPIANKTKAKTYSVSTSKDLRWQRCHIKSTALLGNVLHFQEGYEKGSDETLLFNSKSELTEASACNAFIVKNGIVITPPLDNQLLPGITRNMLIDILRKDGTIEVQERIVSMNEVYEADEIWITSSTKEIGAVTSIDGQSVGDGEVGNTWLAAQTLFSRHKYDY
ncbi:MAG TPA: D-alanine aminotransferase [Porticoccaceae bacterium]|jgi:D-alanine transaminase|nr:D-alanine aminotransferase [Porticoccaceae bacterium]